MNHYSFKTTFLIILTIIFYINQAHAQPASCNAVIGNPANGVAHYIDISWTVVAGASAYELEVSADGTTNWTNVYSGSATSYSHNTGNLGNTPYYYRVRSVNGGASAYTNAVPFPIYTAADEPALPQLSNATPASLSISLPAETPVANPANTTYSIFCTTTGQYVQADGTLDATEIFQTRADWGTITVTGLAANTNYCFYSKARNEDGDIRTAQGATILATETFSTNANFATAGNPTNRFYSPSSCTTGGLIYSNTEGCPAGSVGYSGAWNNNFGCYLRTPTANCTGSNSVTLTFDISHSHTAATPNNRMRIYFYADGGYTSNAITSLKIDGVNALASFGVNGQGISYTEIRNCGDVEVVFDISGVANKSNILFYLEPSSAYNNSQPFYTWIDNVGITGSANAAACLSTTACTAPSLQNNPVNQAVCAGGNTSFSVNVTGSISGYQWQENSGNGFVDINNGGIYSNANTATLNITGVGAGNNGYQYRCIINAACGNDITSGTAVLTVNTLPDDAEPIDGSTSVCRNSNETYSIAPINNAASYLWTLPTGVSIVSGNNTDTITAAFSANAQAGDITVAGVNTCGTGTASSLTIAVKEVPEQPNSISGKTEVCEGSTESYEIAPVSGVDSYIWQIPSDWTNDNSATEITSVTFGNNSGVIGIAATNECGNSAVQTLAVTVTVLPSAPDTILAPDTVCAGSLVVLEALPVPESGTVYEWTSDWGTKNIISANSVSYTADNNSTVIEVSAVNNCGISPTVFKTIAVYEPVLVTFDFTENPVCSGVSPFELTEGTPSGGTYSGIGVDASGYFSPVAAGIGNHVITYTIVEHGCVYEDTAVIEVEVCPGVDNTKATAVVIYPNPFRDMLTLEMFHAQKIVITDISGSIIYEQYLDTGTSLHTIRMKESVSAGVYLVHLTNIKGYSVVKKLIKE